jgi:hypothetical protein
MPCGFADDLQKTFEGGSRKRISLEVLGTFAGEQRSNIRDSLGHMLDAARRSVAH